MKYKILYDYVIVPRTFTNKPEVVLNRNYVLAKAENVLVSFEFNKKDILKCIEEQKPELLLAQKNITINGRRLTSIKDFEDIVWKFN